MNRLASVGLWEVLCGFVLDKNLCVRCLFCLQYVLRTWDPFLPTCGGSYSWLQGNAQSIGFTLQRSSHQVSTLAALGQRSQRPPFKIRSGVSPICNVKRAKSMSHHLEPRPGLLFACKGMCEPLHPPLSLLLNLVSTILEWLFDLTEFVHSSS